MRVSRFTAVFLLSWVLPEDYHNKDPCKFNTDMFLSKVGNSCPTLGRLLASRILYALLVGEKQHEIARARFCTYRVSDLVARAIRNAIRANRFARVIRNCTYFYSASGRFARIARISDSRESPDSRESCESIRANHAT